MKAGLATPEQLRKARAEQRREQRRESRGQREGSEGSRAPGLRAPKRSHGGSGARGVPGRQSEGPKDRADRSARERDGGRSRRGGSRGRPAEARAAGDAPRTAAPQPEPTVQALNLRIRELLDRHAENDRSAELAFNFMRENTVRRVFVTDAQRRKLAGGELAIVGFRRRHHIVPSGVADEIQALRPIVFVHRAKAEGSEPLAPDVAAEDDPYRDFPVPDDLHW